MNKIILVPIEVPNWVNDDFVLKKDGEYLKQFIGEAIGVHRLERLCDDVNTGRISLKEWAEAVNWKAPGLTRASSYHQINGDQEIIGPGMPGHTNHPNRPVVMRSSLWCLQRKHRSSPNSLTFNGYCESIFERYMRMRRQYCFEQKALAKVADACEAALRRKFHCGYSLHLTASFSVGHRHGFYSAWINGRYVNRLTEHQFYYIRRLWELSQKIERVHFHIGKQAA